MSDKANIKVGVEIDKSSLSNACSEVASSITKAVSATTNAANEAVKGVTAGVNEVVDGVQDTMSFITSGYDKLIKGMIKDTTEAANTALKDTVNTVSDNVSSGLAGVQNSKKESNGLDGEEEAVTKVKSLREQIQEEMLSFDGFKDAMQQAFVGLPDELKGNFKEMTSSILDSGIELGKSTEDIATEMFRAFNEVRGSIKNGSEDLETDISNIMQTHVADMSNDIRDDFAVAFDDMYEDINLNDSADNIGETLSAMFDNIEEDYNKEVNSMFDNIDFSEADAKAGEALDKLFDDVKPNIEYEDIDTSEINDKAGEALSKMFDDMFKDVKPNINFDDVIKDVFNDDEYTFEKEAKEAGEKVGKAFSDSVEEFVDFPDDDTTGIKKTCDEFIDSIDNVGKKAKNVGKDTSTKIKGFNLVVLNSIVQLTKEAINAIETVSREVYKLVESGAEVESVFRRTGALFGESSEDIVNWANTIEKSYGVCNTELLKSVSSIKALTDSLGAADEQSTEMSKSLTLMAYDLSAKMGYSVEDTMSKLESGLSGASRSTREIGLSVSVATQEMIANNLGIEKNISDMNATEQVYMRYIAMMYEAKNSNGYFADSLNTTSTQLQMMKETFKSITNAIGSIASTLFSVIGKYVVGALSMVSDAVNSIASVIGVKFNKTSKQATKDAESFSGSMFDIADGTEEVADGLEKDSKEAKKAKSSLSGFDELTVANKSDSSSGSSASSKAGGAGSSIDPGLLSALDSFKSDGWETSDMLDGAKDELRDFFNQLTKGNPVIKTIADSFKNIKDRITGLIDSVKELGNVFNYTGIDIGKIVEDIAIGAVAIGSSAIESVIAFITGVIDGIKDYYADNWSDIGSSMEKTLSNIDNKVKNLQSKFKPVIDIIQDLGTKVGYVFGALGLLVAKVIELGLTIGETISPALETLYNTVLEPILDWVKEKIASAIENLAEILTNVTTWIEENKQNFLDVIQFIADIVAGIWTLIEPLADGIWEVFWAILKKLTDVVLSIGGWILDNGEIIVGIIVALTAAMAAYKATLAVASIITAITKATEGMTAANIAATIAEKAMAIAQGALNTVMSLNPIGLIVAAIAALVAGFVLLWNKCEGFRNFWKGLWEGIKAVFSTVWEAIKSGLEALGGFFSALWDGLKNGIQGAFNVIKKIMSAIWDIVKAPINLIISGINILIKGVNKLSFDVPDWVPFIGGKKFGFNIPEIPKLANGGIVTTATQFIAGEAGAEAILPLQNSKFIENFAYEIAERINANRASGGGSNITIGTVVADESSWLWLYNKIKEIGKKVD